MQETDMQISVPRATLSIDAIQTMLNAAVALGAQATTYGAGEPLKADYGDHPFGVVAFLRIRIKGREH